MNPSAKSVHARLDPVHREGSQSKGRLKHDKEEGEKDRIAPDRVYEEVVYTISYGAYAPLVRTVGLSERASDEAVTLIDDIVL
ncbi:Uncharacterised protein [Chlamydia trachomatis]|nr:Uncharacterised protein [Chlamydia trachomatis]